MIALLRDSYEMDSVMGDALSLTIDDWSKWIFPFPTPEDIAWRRAAHHISIHLRSKEDRACW